MSIRVVCPNGHALRVADSFAGKTGLCPVCKARLKVPRPVDVSISEDAILGILGPSETAPREPSPPPPAPHHVGVAVPRHEGLLAPKKSCGRCNREIPAHIHVCPYCHTYIAGLAEV
jgi:hypothetical protein